MERLADEVNICDRDSSSGKAHAVETKTPTLSEREIQILNGLVKGHANKVIARRCGVTEATIKVHMKSILRKIRACNRTQAAIWALEHGYSGAKAAALKSNGAAEPTSIVPSPSPTAVPINLKRQAAAIAQQQQAAKGQPAAPSEQEPT